MQRIDRQHQPQIVAPGAGGGVQDHRRRAGRGVNRIRPWQQREGQRQPPLGQARRRRDWGTGRLDQIAHLHRQKGARHGHPSRLGGIVAVEGGTKQPLGVKGPACTGGKADTLQRRKFVVIRGAPQKTGAGHLMLGHDAGDRGHRQGEIAQHLIRQIGQGQRPGARRSRLGRPGVFQKQGHVGLRNQRIAKRCGPARECPPSARNRPAGRCR